MVFLSEQDTQLLAKWTSWQINLMNRNSNKDSNVNPDILAKFVISLVKQDKGRDGDSLRNYYIDELKAFLKEKTISFVNSLLTSLKDGSYKDTIDFEEDNDNDDSEENEEEDPDTTNRRERERESDDDSDYRRRRGRDRRESDVHNHSSKQTSHHHQNDNNNNTSSSNNNRGGYDNNNNRQRQDYDRNRVINRSRESVNSRHHSEYNNNNNNNSNNHDRNYNNNNNDRNYNTSNNNERSKQRIKSTAVVVNTDEDNNNNNNNNKYGDDDNKRVRPDYNNNINNNNNNNNFPYPPMPFVNPMMPWGGYDMNFFNPMMGNPMMGNFFPPHNMAMFPNPGNNIENEKESYEDDLNNNNPRPPPPLPYGSKQAIDDNNNNEENMDHFNNINYNNEYNPEVDMSGEYNMASVHNNIPMLSGFPYYQQQQQFPIITTNKPLPPQRTQNSYRQNHMQKNLLPENERCTLKCTGLPTYLTEEQIKEHFSSFGFIVELQVSPMSNNNNDNKGNNEERKVYNECLVQFLSPANAKKCFNSPIPVLNNRFIKLFQSNFNIKMLSDVSIPNYEATVEGDRLLLSKEIVPTYTNVSALVSNLKKKKANNIFADGTVSNKYRRIETPVVEKQVDAITATTTTTNEDDIATSTTPVAATPKPVVVTEEQLEMKKSFEELKTLKQQQEVIWKKKESLLQAQVDKYREMMDKLDTTEGESEARAALLQNLETKIVDLQSQLRSHREQMEKSLATVSSPPTVVVGDKSSGHKYNSYQSGGRGYFGSNIRGRGGRFSYPARGRGRGNNSWVASYNSVDIDNNDDEKVDDSKAEEIVSE